MKNQIALFAVLLALSIANADEQLDYKLPENGKIKVATLTGSYSCPAAGVFTTLHLNRDTFHNGNYYPELQMNFACGSTPSLEGGDLSLIAEMGDVPLEQITTLTAQAPSWTVGESYNFRRSAVIKEGTTYSVMLNSFKYRGLLVFRVISYKSNILTIEYVTRSYSLIKETETSKFIDYKEPNSR